MNETETMTTPIESIRIFEDEVWIRRGKYRFYKRYSLSSLMRLNRAVQNVEWAIKRRDHGSFLYDVRLAVKEVA